MSCTLNPINNCKMSVGGVQRLWLIPFGHLTDLVYVPNNLSVITDYSLLSIPTELKCNRSSSSFQSTFNVDTKKHSLTHNLNVDVSLMEEVKRTEFEKIIHQDWTIIFKDMNGQCWCMGYDNPVRVAEFNPQTGAQGDFNGYSINFQSISREQIKEIACFDSACFASFNGEELRTSVFQINNASSSVGITNFEIVSDTLLLQQTVTQTLEPWLWSNPVIKQRDINTIQTLIQANDAADLFYDLVSDTAYIVIYSTSNSYDSFKFDVNNPYRSQVQIQLNLSILTGTISAGSTVTVTDDNSVVLYTGLINDPITGTGLSGTVGNAIINVSALYGRSVTFTATITGTTCETRQYTYTYESLTICDAEVQSEVIEGATYELTFSPYDFAPSYRRMRFYYNGNVVELYNQYPDYHSDFSLLSTDIINALISLSTDIIPTTIEVTNTGNITVKFTSTNTNSYFFVQLYGRGFSTYGTTESRIISGVKTVLLNVHTVTAQNNITISQSGNVIQGLNGQSPTTVSGFVIEDALDIANDGTTDNISFVLNDFIEDSVFDVQTNSASCPTFNNPVEATTCYDGIDQTITGTYWYLECDISSQTDTELGNNFIININGTPTSITSVGINAATSGADLSAVLNLLGVKLMNFYYNHTQMRYVMEVIVQHTHSFSMTCVDAGLLFNPIQDLDVKQYSVYPVLHPNILSTINCPTSDFTTPTITRTGNMSDAFNHDVIQNNQLVSLSYNSGTGNMTYNFAINNDLTDFIRLKFYNTFPTPTATPMITYTINKPTLSGTLNYQSDLASSGFVPNNTAFVVAETNFGLQLIQQYVIATTPAVTLSEVHYNRSIWGRHQSFQVLTPDAGAHSISFSYTSILCPAFTPLSLSGLRTWVRPETLSYSWLSNSQTATVTNGSNSITVTGGTYFIGIMISFNAGATYYTITGGSGTTLILNRAVTETSGSYSVHLARTTSLTDSSPFARSITAAGSGGNTYFKPSVINGWNCLYMTKEQGFAISPITATNPASLQMFAVVRHNSADSLNILFTHRSSTQTLVQFSVNNSQEALTQYRDSVIVSVRNANSTVNKFSLPAFNLYSWLFEQQTSPALDSGQAWNNGDYATRGTNSFDCSGNFNATQQYFGIFNAGSGYAGDIAEIVVCESLSLSDMQKVEGYLAWKFNLQSQLPSSHPYKLIRP